MATVISTFNNVIGFNNSLKQATWTPLTTTNADGSPFEFPDWADNTVHVFGTFGVGGTVLVEGSNDGTNWATLTDSNGTTLSLTVASVKAINERPRYLRPRVSAGDGTTSITAILLARRIESIS